MLLAHLARRLWLVPLLPRALSVSALAVALSAGIADAQRFGRNGPSFPPPKVHPISPPRVEWPKPQYRPPKAPPLPTMPKPTFSLPTVPRPPVTLPPVRTPNVPLPPVSLPDPKLPKIVIPLLKPPPSTASEITDPFTVSKPKTGGTAGMKNQTGGQPLGTTASGKPQPGPKPPAGKHQWPGHPTTVVVVVPGGLLKRPGHLVGPLVPVAPGQLIGPVVPAQPVPAAPEVTAEPTVAPSFVPPAGGEALPTAAGTSNALRVTERVVDGPAYKSGIQLGDILLKVGERRVKTPDDLQPALAAAKGKIAVVYYNAEAKKVATCEVTPDGDSMGIGVVGITVEIEDEATSSEAQAEGSVTPPPGTETAVQITELIPRGLAARAGLQVGDVILTVNGKRVVAPEQFVALLKEARGTAEVLFVSPEDGKAEKRTLNGGGGEIGVKVRTVAVASE